ncbi:MAG: DUF481 domain-containing protein [Elusimicrobiota bacterium]
MKTGILTLGVAIAAAALPLHAEDAPEKKWKNAAEVSVVSTNGNSKTQTTAAKNVFNYQFNAQTALDVEGGGLGSRSKGAVTSEQYYASEKVTLKLDDRNYVYEKYRWDRDRFKDLAHRHDFAAGVGREMWKTAKNLLILEAAPGYVNEEHLQTPRKTFASSRVYVKYTREFSPSSRFTQDAEWVQSFKDKRDTRINTETAVTAALNSLFSVKNSFIWKHDSRPPTGVSKDDTILSVAMIASF